MSKYIIPDAKMVEKGWGYPFGKKKNVGEIWAYQEKDEDSSHKLRKVETVKVLYFAKGKRLSLHFHKNKEEIFMCAHGRLEVETISPDGNLAVQLMALGDRVIIPACTPHRMTGLDDLNILIEVSTHHEDSDSYRIEKGD